MLTLVFQFALAAAVVAGAGVFLTRFADRISDLTGMGRSLAGLILLASATSLPELTVDCNAAIIGAPNIAVGDLLGSSLFNLLILGCIDLVHRSKSRMLSATSAAHALSAIVSMVLTSLVGLFIMLSTGVGVLGVGIGPLVIWGVYLLSVRVIFVDQRLAAIAATGEAAAELAEEPSPTEAAGAAAWRAIAGYAACATVILLAGRFLAVTADKLAEATGLGGTFTGTSLVALSTSLPEMVTTITAVRMGAFDMAVGNIFGSNCFNASILWIVDAFYRPGAILSAVEPVHMITAWAVVIITGTATMGLLYRTEKRIWLIEPDALLVVLLCLGALVLVFQKGVMS
jgi:cation:H+ antiporter